MELTIGSRLRRAVNAFMNRDPTSNYQNIGPSYSYRPDRTRLTRGNERTIVTAIFNRIAMDVAAIDIRHCVLDENNRFLQYKDSGLNNCLSLEANIDQTGRAFIQDVVMSMLDEGVVALVPIDTSIYPLISGSFDIISNRPMFLACFATDGLLAPIYCVITANIPVDIIENIIINILKYVLAVPTAPTALSFRLLNIRVSTIPANIKKSISQKIGPNRLNNVLFFIHNSLKMYLSWETKIQ